MVIKLSWQDIFKKALIKHRQEQIANITSQKPRFLPGEFNDKMTKEEFDYIIQEIKKLTIKIKD